MKALIVEDDFTSRTLLQGILKNYGDSHVAVDGGEAVTAVSQALEAGDPYHLICLDITMPGMDGQQALREIRRIERSHGLAPGQGARVLMTTASSDRNNVMTAFREEADGYILKPVDRARLHAYLREFDLLSDAA